MAEIKLRLKKVSSWFTGSPRFRLRVFLGSVSQPPPHVAGSRDVFTSAFAAMSKLKRKDRRKAKATASQQRAKRQRRGGAALLGRKVAVGALAGRYPDQ